MSKICLLTKKKTFVSNKVSHSNIKNKKKKYINFVKIKIWFYNNFRNILISKKSLKIIKKCIFL